MLTSRAGSSSAREGVSRRGTQPERECHGAKIQPPPDLQETLMTANDDDAVNQTDISHLSASRRVTLKQVAERAGVSPAAASAALTGRRGTTRVSAETAEMIQKAAIELGYQPNALARGLATRQTGVLS